METGHGLFSKRLRKILGFTKYLGVDTWKAFNTNEVISSEG